MNSIERGTRLNILGLTKNFGNNSVLQNVNLQVAPGEFVALVERSGCGQRQRVALARGLASQSRLQLLGEPLGALDALTRIEMQQLIENLWLEQKFAAILVTHDVEEAIAWY